MSEITPPRVFVIIDRVTINPEFTYGPLFKGLVGPLRRVWWWLTRKPKTFAKTARLMVNGEVTYTFKNLRDYATSIYTIDPLLVCYLDDEICIEISPPDAYYAPTIEINIMKRGLDLRRNP